MQLETWASGDAYEQYMGRWSAQIAALFLDKLDVKPNARWLDVGCGTGAVSRAITGYTFGGYAQAQNITALDLSFDFVRYARRQSPSVEFINASATALPLVSNHYHAVVSGLMLNFVPQPETAVREFWRVAKAGGIAAAYLWDYAGKMEFLRYFWDAAVALKPEAKALHEGYRFPICQPEALKALWEGAGLKHVSVQALDVPTVFENFEAYWQIFTAGKFPAPQYLLSLDENSRQTLREQLRAAVPIQDDGSIQFIARAWAVIGEKQAKA
jgi:SAM-dependent methyltransferase